jgi:hypothetical protein
MAINIPNHRAIMRKYKGVQGIHLEGTKIKGWPSDVEQPTQTQVDAWTIEYELAKAWSDLRQERDTKLAKSDWRAMPDAPTMSDAWKAYRKKLRDLPSTLDDTTVLKTITWPTEPS